VGEQLDEFIVIVLIDIPHTKLGERLDEFIVIVLNDIPHT
jgi:hypothetical protein